MNKVTWWCAGLMVNGQIPISPMKQADSYDSAKLQGLEYIKTHFNGNGTLNIYKKYNTKIVVYNNIAKTRLFTIDTIPKHLLQTAIDNVNLHIRLCRKRDIDRLKAIPLNDRINALYPISRILNRKFSIKAIRENLCLFTADGAFVLFMPCPAEELQDGKIIMFDNATMDQNVF